MPYVTVANRRNSIATVHVERCGTLGTPSASLENAVRHKFGDGLEALECAQAEQPQNYGFCAICLKGAQELIKGAR